MLAVGYHDGLVRIFKLRAALCDQHANDMRVLKSYLDKEEDEERKAAEVV